jgi:hypothetical protein
MKKIYLSFLLISFPGLVFSQTRITGLVTDKNNSPLPGANVYIKDTYDGTSSSADGTFSFSTRETGKALLIVSFIGYKQAERQISLNGSELHIEIELEEDSKELGTVVISAGSFEASDENKAVILRPLDIVTTAGSSADIYAALETLPGTQQVGEADGLFVRGGSASETKTIIDEMVVQNPFYSSVPDIPSRGRFSAFLFKGTVFSTGGYSAQYGQALSSALILKTQDLADETLTSISLLPLGIGGSHSQRWEKSSFSTELFFSNLSPYFKLQKERTDWKIAPRGFDGSFNFRQKFSKSGMLKLFSSVSFGDLSLYMKNLDNPGVKDFFGQKSSNYYLNANYRDIIDNDWTIFLGASYSYDKDKIDLAPDKAGELEELSQAKLTVTKNIIGSSFLTFGGEIQNAVYQNSFNEFGNHLNEVLSAGYTEADIFFTNDFAGRAGVRAEYSKLLNKVNVAPRLSLAYRIGNEDQFNLAYGIFYETPDKDFLLTSAVSGKIDFDFERAAHYIFNFQHISEARTFRIELYYKDYDKLAKGTLYNSYPFFSQLPFVPFSNEGNGYAKGIDIFWRDRETFYMTDYWISYSFLDTKREFSNYPTLAFPTFATPHTFSVVAKRWIPEITTSFGITYTFATGRPYFNPNNPEFLGDRGKNYNNLSLSLSYLTSIFKSFTIVFVSMDNLPGFRNIFGYRYSSDGRYREPVIPTVLRSAIIGVFINIGQTNPY